MTKNYYKSIFLLCVWPNNEWKLFIFFLYEICLDEQMFHVFMCHHIPCDHILASSRESVCLKMAKIYSKSCFDLMMIGSVFQIHFFIWNMYSWICSHFNLSWWPLWRHINPFHGTKMGKNHQKWYNINISCTFWHLVFETLPRDPALMACFIYMFKMLVIRA